MAIDFPSSPTTNQQYTYNGVLYTYTSQGMWVAAGGGVTGSTPPQGRLTLQTLTPVMITTQLVKTTIYYTPYTGNKVPIYDGTNFVMTTFAELSNVTTASSVGNAGPAAVAASGIYDLFVWSNGGTVTLTRGPAWTSDTVRSAGTALVTVNGVLLNNASITNGPVAQRGTYVGSVRSGVGSTISVQFPIAAAGGGNGVFQVWNAYNRIISGGFVADTTASWTYNSTTYRQMNAAVGTGNQVTFLVGLQEDYFTASAFLTATNDASGTRGIVGLGLDTLTTPSGLHFDPHSVPSQNAGLYTELTQQPTIGYHTLAVLEACTAANVVSFVGSIASAPARNRAGMIFNMPM